MIQTVLWYQEKGYGVTQKTILVTINSTYNWVTLVNKLLFNFFL